MANRLLKNVFAAGDVRQNPIALWLLGVLILPLASCHYLRSADAPMLRLFYPQANNYGYQETFTRTAPDLLVLLPGIAGTPEEFSRKGLIEQVADADIPVDVLVADAHFGYYRERSLLHRLQEDVLAPARAAGYQRIYVAGISLGGFGALLHWRDTGGKAVDAVLLMTPYLGEPEYYAHKLDDNRQAQALDEDKNIWPWLDTTTESTRSHWYLARAESDRFMVPNGLLAEMLPEDNHVTLPGDHNWQTWRRLWPELLSRLKRDFYPETVAANRTASTERDSDE